MRTERMRGREIFLLVLPLFVHINAQWCQTSISDRGPELPKLADSYSSQIQINYESEHYTAEVIKKVDSVYQRHSLELTTNSTHMKFISLKASDSFLIIDYSSRSPTCTYNKLSQTNKYVVYRQKNAKPLDVLQIIADKMISKPENFRGLTKGVVRGIFVEQWEMCAEISELNSEIRVVMSFSVPPWMPAYPLKKSETSANELVRIEVFSRDGKKEYTLTSDFYNYQPLSLDEKDFQAPEGVHCQGFRTGNKPPSLPNYFSFKSERIIFQDSTLQSPVVKHYSVNYDFAAGFIRIDVQDIKGKNPFSSAEGLVQAFVFDFNTGIQYTLDTSLESCSMDVFNATFDIFTTLNNPTPTMLDPEKFLILNSESMSYNGQFETRGLPTDVYSVSIKSAEKSGTVFLYFTQDTAKLVEEDEIRKNVLVKMMFYPESSSRKREFEVINFYNFVQGQPSSSVFSFSSCYNETQSKSFVLSFPGLYNQHFEESPGLVSSKLQEALSKESGISIQRVAVEKLSFQKQYLLSEFRILDLPPIRGKVYRPVPKEENLENAVNRLKKSIEDGTFRVSVMTSSKIYISLKPETIVEFTASRNELEANTFNEGSVVGVSIGMTLLGFFLGAVVVNLVISKKFGVSLFQKHGFGSGSFQNPLNESSI